MPYLRAQIDALSAAYPKVDRFLESPDAPFAATCDHPTSEHIDALVGRYKLLEQISKALPGPHRPTSLRSPKWGHTPAPPVRATPTDD